MNTVDFLIDNFQTALKIHESCDKMGFSVDDARLFTYINYVVDKNDGDLEYFNKGDVLAVETLEFLLNKRMPDIAPEYEKAFDSLNSIPERIKRIDGLLLDKFGMEFRIQSELLNRLRMYTEKKFRNRIMTNYIERILPCLSSKESFAH
jgi:hypothetical protein